VHVTRHLKPSKKTAPITTSLAVVKPQAKPRATPATPTTPHGLAKTPFRKSARANFSELSNATTS